jgi:hypothetical protein
VNGHYHNVRLGANLGRREEFVAMIRAIAPKQLIFLDESGVLLR